MAVSAIPVTYFPGSDHRSSSVRWIAQVMKSV